MDIMKCLIRLLPGWQGAVWSNSYDGIKPHELETRPIPKYEELVEIWPVIQKEEADAAHNEAIKASLAEIDLKSIRSIREWLAKQDGAPQYIKDYEAEASTLRAQIIKE